MASNKTIKDGAGVSFTTKTTETAGVNVAHVNVDNFPVGGSTEATLAAVLAVNGTLSDFESPTGNGSQISLLKRIRTLLGGLLTDTQLRAAPVVVQGVVGGVPQTVVTSPDSPNSAQAHQAITPTATASLISALGFTLDASTKKCLIQADSGAFRITLNGTAPSSTLGFLISQGNMRSLSRAEIIAAKVISSSGTPVIQISASL